MTLNSKWKYFDKSRERPPKKGKASFILVVPFTALLLWNERALNFHFVLQPTNYVASPAYTALYWILSQCQVISVSFCLSFFLKLMWNRFAFQICVLYVPPHVNVLLDLPQWTCQPPHSQKFLLDCIIGPELPRLAYLADRLHQCMSVGLQQEFQ